MIRTLSEARQAAKDEPKRWRACVYEATGTPITEQPDTKVHLFCHVKTAQEKLRDLETKAKQLGYQRIFGTLGNGMLGLELAGEQLWLCIDKRRTA